jgi:predicted nucleic acid-binding protein
MKGTRGYLIDTNALSILSPRTASPRAGTSAAAAFRTWVQAHDEDLFLSVITLAEIQAGVSRLERKGAAKRAADLSRWLSAVLELYQPRTLPLASDAALEAGRMLDRAAGAGAAPGFEDAAIAATASIHGPTVVTANVRHFRHFGVPFISPPTE